MKARSLARCAWLAVALAALPLPGWADGSPPAGPAGGRLRSDWPQRLTEAGCTPVPGQADERRCRTRDSFVVCKEAVDSGHLKRCQLAGSKETYPPGR